MVQKLLLKNPDERPDAKSILKIKEIEIVVEKIVENMCVSNNRVIARTLIDEHNLATPKIKELQQIMVGFFLLNSKCAIEWREKMYLLELLNYKPVNTTMLYRGSDHGWKFIDFHSRCDYKGPTISLFKVEDGDCIGGFTTA